MPGPEFVVHIFDQLLGMVAELDPDVRQQVGEGVATGRVTFTLEDMDDPAFVALCLNLDGEEVARLVVEAWADP